MQTMWMELKKIPDLTQNNYAVLPNSAPDSLLAQFEPSLKMLHRLGSSFQLQIRLKIIFDIQQELGQQLKILLGFSGQLENIQTAPFLATWLATPIASYFAPLMDTPQLEQNETNPKALGLLGCEVTRKERYWALSDLGDESFQRFSKLPKWLHAVYMWQSNSSNRLIGLFKLMQKLGTSSAMTLLLEPCEGQEEYEILYPFYSSSLTNLSGGNYKDVLGKSEYVKANSIGQQISSLRQELLDKLRCEPCFKMQLRLYANSRNTAQLLADTLMAEALDDGPHACWSLPAEHDFFENLNLDFTSLKPPERVSLPPELKKLSKLFSLKEIESVFRLPVLYDGEQLDLKKETWPSLVSPEQNKIVLGHIISANSHHQSNHVKAQESVISLPVDILVKHTLVVGVPGSGKTNTLMSLASQVWREHKIPFLILEPAKREYRGLLNLPGCSGQVLLFAPGRSIAKHLQLEGVFNPLGLKINPFEIPIDYSVAEHKSNLLAIFKAAFGLWTPLPSLIASAINMAYAELGWQNEDTASQEKIKRHGFPYMHRFVELVMKNANETSYAGENAATVKAYLEYQIGGLIQAPLSEVFDCEKSTLSPEKWLATPVIVELESLGESNANFISLLLQTYLRECLTVVQEKERENNLFPTAGNKLKHLLFLEEAHNLIGPLAYSPDEKSPDAKAAATVFVVKLLAEVRALGLGIVIGDQLPSSLAAEVLKNTNVRICHRLSAPDDRSKMQQSMSATELQLDQMANLVSGQALVSWEGIKKPFLLKVLAVDSPLARQNLPVSDSEFLNQIVFDARYLANAMLMSEKIQDYLQERPYPILSASPIKLSHLLEVFEQFVKINELKNVSHQWPVFQEIFGFWMNGAKDFDSTAVIENTLESWKLSAYLPLFELIQRELLHRIKLISKLKNAWFLALEMQWFAYKSKDELLLLVEKNNSALVALNDLLERLNWLSHYYKNQLIENKIISYLNNEGSQFNDQETNEIKSLEQQQLDLLILATNILACFNQKTQSLQDLTFNLEPTKQISLTNAQEPKQDYFVDLKHLLIQANFERGVVLLDEFLNYFETPKNELNLSAVSYYFRKRFCSILEIAKLSMLQAIQQNGFNKNNATLLLQLRVQKISNLIQQLGSQ